MSERSLLIRKPLLVRKPLSIAVAVICTSLSANVLAQEEAQATDEQMVVTATRTEMALKQAPASMSVITAQDIEDSPGITLADIVAESTSVESDFDSTRAGRQMISIRGMDSDYTLIMVNGRRLSSASAIIRGNDFDLSTIPADSIERVEIIRGPMSALYGSDGMGGTINIITKAPENDWSSTLSMDTSSPLDGDGGEEYSMGFTTSGALIEDELFARLSVNQTSRDAWQPYSGTHSSGYDRSDITALEERETLSLLASLTWNATDNQTIDFDFGYSDDERESSAENVSSVIESDTRVVRQSQAIKGWCDIVGNEDLNPETSWNYEIAALYTQPRWNVEGALFRNEIQDLIDRGDTECRSGGTWGGNGFGCVDTGGNFVSKGTRSYVNVSEAVIQGAELTGQFQITDEWGVSGNYTFLDTEDKSTGEELLERYKHSGLVKLNWSPTYDLNTFISARYRGERNIETDLTQEAYTTLNIGGVYNINDSVRVRAGITNLTDEAVSQELESMGYVEEPRTYYVGMTADF
ncbi:TonB-dependent receptor domain-containing protein [Vibrio splendidus]|uniref:TonB-dependent receptor domain-containing protein n=1 Tax=Vibrio splendidus TaxID=29497 RepID=UPI000D3D12A9|nr:TonB-dependent receptor [Vibrio splendidus]PTP50079.1 TonB-dependent receptor [Vibrio splendidus]